VRETAVAGNELSRSRADDQRIPHQRLHRPVDPREISKRPLLTVVPASTILCTADIRTGDICVVSIPGGERIDLRVPEGVKERIRKSAALTGRSMSDFIITAALQQAEETMAAVERWEMDETDSRFVMSLLLAPPREIPNLRKLMTGIRSKQMRKKNETRAAS
jgi:uncharacterized protein (DUF1778 family)